MIVLDLNVVLDVIQKRPQHYAASAAVVDRVVRCKECGALPAHAYTTIHFLVARYATAGAADKAIDWLLRYFTVAAIGLPELSRARSLGWTDFEDAVVASAAASVEAVAIVTRNVKDFGECSIPVLTPEEYLLQVNDENQA